MQFFQRKQLNQSVNLHYQWQANGKAHTIVFINALGTDCRIWDEVTKNLENDANTLVFDKQGHGLSSLSANTHSLHDYMDDLIALLDYLHINRCHVVGLSVGGMIAQLMAHHHPERVDKLILCDTRHKIGDAAGWHARINQVTVGGVAAVADAVLQRWFSPDFQTANPNVVAGIRTMLERCPTNGYIQTCGAIRDADLTEKSKTINHQTLCIVGSEDKSTSPADVRDLHQLIAGSRFEIIPCSGHLPCVDNAKELSRLIREFVSA
jgi:3-oxoadipate enol-lactonase